MVFTVVAGYNTNNFYFYVNLFYIMNKEIMASIKYYYFKIK